MPQFDLNTKVTVMMKLGAFGGNLHLLWLLHLSLAFFYLIDRILKFLHSENAIFQNQQQSASD